MQLLRCRRFYWFSIAVRFAGFRILCVSLAKDFARCQPHDSVILSPFRVVKYVGGDMQRNSFYDRIRWNKQTGIRLDEVSILRSVIADKFVECNGSLAKRWRINFAGSAAALFRATREKWLMSGGLVFTERESWLQGFVIVEECAVPMNKKYLLKAADETFSNYNRLVHRVVEKNINPMIEKHNRKI